MPWPQQGLPCLQFAVPAHPILPFCPTPCPPRLAEPSLISEDSPPQISLSSLPHPSQAPPTGTGGRREKSSSGAEASVE